PARDRVRVQPARGQQVEAVSVDTFRHRIEAYLSDPINFPLAFKKWLTNYTEAPIPIKNTTNGAGASVAAGTSSVTVTHGLGVAPLRVYLSPTSDTQGRRWWVSAKGATTFTISLDSNAVTNPITFDWTTQF